MKDKTTETPKSYGTRSWTFHLLALPLLVLCLAAAWLAGGKEGPAGDVVEVRFWHAMSGPLGDVMLKIIDRFNEDGHTVAVRDESGRTREVPIRVHPVFQGGYAQLSQKIIAATMAGSPPDLAQVYESWVMYLNRTRGEESILELDPFVARDPSIDLDDVYPVFIRNNTFDGKLLSLPFNKSFPVLFYNKELFKKHGLDPNRPPETWDDFVDMARRLTVDLDGDGAPDQWGWAFNIDSWLLEGIMLQQGGRLIDEAGTRAFFDSPEARAALQMLIDATHGPKRYAYKVSGYDHQQGFGMQRVAMIITSSVSRAYMADRLEFDYGIAPVPQGRQKAAIMAGTNVAIFRAARPAVRQAAWEFLRYFISPKVTAYWGRKTNYVPVRRSALRVEQMAKHLARDPNARAAIDQMDYAYFEPRLPAWYECRQILNSTIERALTRPERALEYLDQANVDINKSLAKNRL